MIKGALVVGSSQIRMLGALMVGAPYDLATLAQLIKDLFKSNEVGFAYDPNDLTTLYQDAAGTVPVTGAGQPVGLVLDKSKGLVLGGELNSNNFNIDLSGWYIGANTQAVIENGEARVNFGGAITSTASNWFALAGQYIPGKWYIVEFDATYISGGNLQCGAGFVANLIVTPASNAGIKTRYKCYVSGTNPASTQGIIAFGASSASSVWKIDNVSVKELTGNHAYQATSAQRPLLVANPQQLDYDTVDDKLITNLPAQLTGCTVIRAVPNVGTQILTNQTIPTPYNDNTDHCGLIVINRALTTTETSQITKLFNKAAGV